MYLFLYVQLTEAEARQAGLKVDDDETLKEMLEVNATGNDNIKCSDLSF